MLQPSHKPLDDFQDIERPSQHACLDGQQAKSFWSVHKKTICTVMGAVLAIVMIISLCFGRTGHASSQSAAVHTEATTGMPQDVQTNTAPVVSQLPLRLSRIIIPEVMSGRQTVTVVFNRAVIALGSNFGPATSQGVEGVKVDGRDPLLWQCNGAAFTATPPVEGLARWVTTSILRFDPSEDWPTDLDCSIKVNPELRSFDGTVFDNTGFLVHFITPQLFFSLLEVTSEQTLKLTDGNWVAQLPNDVLPECPPDAVLTLSFNTAVDVSMVQEHLRIVDKANVSRPVTVVDGNAQQVKVTLPTLEVGGHYALTIPAGVKVSANSGPTNAAISVKVMGLQPFTFPWNTNEFTKLAHTNVRLLVRHGLSASTDLQQLQAAITIEPPIGNWTLYQTSVTVLTILGDFQPGTTYEFIVANDTDIVDGYGLPLQSSSVLKGTDSLSPFLAGPFSFTLSNAGTPDIQFIGRGALGITSSQENPFQQCEGRLLKLKPISASEIVGALNAINHDCGRSELFVSNDTIIVGLVNGADLAEYTVPGDDLFGSSGIYLQQIQIGFPAPWQTSCFELPSSSCSLGADAIFGVSTTVIDNYLNVWVTYLDTAQPVCEANVYLYYTEPGQPVVEAQGSGVTNTVGMASFSVAQSGSVTVVVEKDGRLALVSTYVSIYREQIYYAGDLLTDRGLYRAGEEVYVKGYVQIYDSLGTSLRISDYPSDVKLEAYWGETSAFYVVPVNLTFGSFVATLPIPADVKYGVKSITLSTAFEPADGTRSITSTSIVIADPRVPTGVLEFSTSDTVFRPQDDGIQLAIATKTYLGTLAKSTVVTLLWSVGDKTGTQTVELPEGSLQYTFQLRTPILTEAAESQSTLNIKAQWFTPARDLLTEEVNVLVAKSTWSGALSVSTQDIIPGYMYNAQLRLIIRESTAVTTEPPVVFRFAVDNATESDEDLFQQGTEGNTTIQYTWDEMSASQTIISATIPFTLPSIGRYRLIAQFTDDTGLAQYAAVVTGKTEEEWRRAPLTSVRDITAMEFLDSNYTAGSEVRLRWVSPFATAKALLILQDDVSDSPVSQLLAITAGENIFTFTLESPCNGGCYVVALVITPRQTPITVPVPVSQLLDTTLPSQVTLGPLRIPTLKKDTSLAVETSNPTQMAPGETVKINVSVPIGDATEVAVWVVDKALLDLQPRPLPATLSIQQSNVVVGFPPTVYSSYDSLASGTMLEKAYNLTKERLEVDPWVYTDQWTLGVGRGFDQDTATFLECQYTELTYFPYVFNPLFRDPCRFSPIFFDKGGVTAAPSLNVGGPAMGVTAPTPSEGAAGGGASQVVVPSDLLRSDFKATALFLGSLLPDENGRVSFPFTAPDNLGTWIIQVVAVSVGEDGRTRKYGSGEGELVVKRPVNLLASMPRITRVGDEFQAGCTVTSSISGEVVIGLRFADETSSALRLQSSAQQTVMVEADTPKEVVFQLSCIAVGMTTVQIVAQLGNLSDAFQQELPSLGLQEPVQLATSFAITGDNSSEVATREEGVEFPDAVPQSGTLAITAGVGRFPSVQSLSNAVAQQVEISHGLYGYSWATDLLSLAALPAIVQDYAAAQSIINELRRNSSAALTELTQYSSSIGLLDIPVAKVQYPYRSFSLNVYAIFVITRVPQQVIQQSLLGQSQISTWKAAVQEALDYEWATGSPSSLYKWEMLAEVYFAYGVESCPLSIKEQYPISALVANASKLGNAQKAKLLVTLIQSDLREKYRGFIVNTTEDFYENIRTVSKTAYIAVRPGSPNADSMQTNALGLWALVISQQYPNDPLIEKLANYVAQADPANMYSFGSQTAVYQMLALTAYDKNTGSSNPDLLLTVEETQTSQILLQRRFTDGADPPVVYSAPWEEVSGNQTPRLSFGAVGTGEASISLGLEFIPLTTFTDPVYFGIYVEKVIIVLLQNGSTVKYDPETPLQPGQTVKVIIQVTTVDDLSSSVVVTDPLPGGLEAVDPNVGAPTEFGSISFGPVSFGPVLFGEPSFGPVSFGGSSDPTLLFPNAPERWSFPTMEVRKDVVTFVASYLPAGTHTCIYEAVVVTSGTFPLPPAKASMTTQPEVMGLSNTFLIEVAARS